MNDWRWRMESSSGEIEMLRRRIAEACCVLGRLDITASTYGHVSGRLPGSDRIFIRARGPAESGVRYTTADDVVEVDLDGRRVGGRDDDGLTAPVEVFIHTELYKSRPDVYAVTHVHPASAVLLTICQLPLAPLFGAYDPHSLALVLAGVPRFDRSILIRTPELGRSIADLMANSQACLMHGHGVTTAANSVEEAALCAIHLNTVATLTCQAHAIGGARPIEQQDQEEFRVLIDQSKSTPIPGAPSDVATGLWRYYTRHTRDA